MTEPIIGSSKEATRGGFQSIVEVEGILQEIKRVESKFTENRFNKDKGPNDQAEITLEEATILAMEEGEPEPDLKDDKFVTWMNYAAKGKTKPNVNTFFVKAFMKSAEAVEAKRRGVKPEEGILSNLYGTRVVLRKASVLLFKKHPEGKPDESEDVMGTGYIVVEGDEASVEMLEAHVTTLVLGKTPASAKRALLLDARAKKHLEYREALDKGTLAQTLGIKLVGGKFVEGIAH